VRFLKLKKSGLAIELSLRKVKFIDQEASD